MIASIRSHIENEKSEQFSVSISIGHQTALIRVDFLAKKKLGCSSTRVAFFRVTELFFIEQKKTD